MSDMATVCRLLKEIRDILAKQAGGSEDSPGTCRTCGKDIIWKKSRKGKWYPVNKDGSFHSSTCEPPEEEEEEDEPETDDIPF